MSVVDLDLARAEAILAKSGMVRRGAAPDKDCYRELAAELFQVPYEDVTQEQRAAAKELTYLNAYSGSPV